VQAWNIMGGLDWQALPIVVAMLGISDPEDLIMQLVAVREHTRAQGKS
jgi:hypothetical protein